MAGRAVLFDGHKNAIAITVDSHIDKELQMARGFSFDPELLPGSAPIGNAFCFQCLGDALCVHPCQHKDLTAFSVLGDRRQEPVAIENETCGIKYHMI